MSPEEWLAQQQQTTAGAASPSSAIQPMSPEQWMQQTAQQPAAVAPAAPQQESIQQLPTLLGAAKSFLPELPSAGDIAGGLVKGASNIGTTILGALQVPELAAKIPQQENQVLESIRTSLTLPSEQRRAAVTSGLKDMGVDTESYGYKGGEIASEIAGTAGAGAVLAGGMKAAQVAKYLPGLTKSIESFGTLIPSGTKSNVIKNTITRMTGGAIAGGASTALINPEDAAQGAVVTGAIASVLPMGRVVGGKIYDMATGNIYKQRAGKILLDSIGDAPGAVDQARDVLTKASGLNITTAQALQGKTGVSQTVQALGKLAESQNPDVLNSVTGSIVKSQLAEHQAKLARYAGGVTQEEAAIAAADMSGLIKETLDPVRIQAMDLARKGNASIGPLMSKSAQAMSKYVTLMQDVGKMFTYGKQMLTKGDSVAAQRLGFKTPVAQNELVSKIDSALADTTISPQFRDALSTARERVVNNQNLTDVQNYLSAVERGELTGAENIGWTFGVQRDRYYSRAGEAFTAADEMAAMAKASKAQAEMLSAQKDALDAMGIKELNAERIASSIDAIATQPGTSDVTRKALAKVAKNIRKRQNESGLIDPLDLHAIRKSDINRIIAKLSENDPALKGELTSNLDSIKGVIDSAIIDASGGNRIWKTWLDSFAVGANQVKQMQFMSKMQDMLEFNPKAFVKLAEGKDLKLLQKMFGPKTTSLDKAVGVEQADAIREIGTALKRDMDMALEATASAEKLQTIIKKTSSGFQLPNFISAKIALTNAALRDLNYVINEKTIAKVAMAMTKPEKALKLLNSASPKERLDIYNLMKALQSGVPAMAASPQESVPAATRYEIPQQQFIPQQSMPTPQQPFPVPQQPSTDTEEVQRTAILNQKIKDAYFKAGASIEQIAGATRRDPALIQQIINS